MDIFFENGTILRTEKLLSGQWDRILKGGTFLLSRDVWSSLCVAAECLKYILKLHNCVGYSESFVIYKIGCTISICAIYK